MTEAKHPGEEIAAGNPWYTDDQFANQLGSLGRRKTIENRWRIFESALCGWLRGDADDGSREPIKILDAGCGDGINLYGLSQIARRLAVPADLYGVDYNPLRVERAAQIESVCTLQQASLMALPFADGTFEVILCNHVLEHVPEDERALRELHRVLKEGGLLILGVPNEGCMIAQLRNHVIQPVIARTTDHVHFYTGSTLRDMLERAGFTVSAMAREGFFLPHLSLNNRLAGYAWGRVLLELCRILVPSQAAGLIAVARKERLIA